jgi:hypothetical protein
VFTLGCFERITPPVAVAPPGEHQSSLLART